MSSILRYTASLRFPHAASGAIVDSVLNFEALAAYALVFCVAGLLLFPLVFVLVAAWAASGDGEAVDKTGRSSTKISFRRTNFDRGAQWLTVPGAETKRARAAMALRRKQELAGSGEEELKKQLVLFKSEDPPSQTGLNLPTIILTPETISD